MLGNGWKSRRKEEKGVQAIALAKGDRMDRNWMPAGLVSVGAGKRAEGSKVNC